MSVYGHSGEDRRKGAVRTDKGRRPHLSTNEARRLMGVHWMTNRDDISDAIPPAYTQYIGEQLIDRLASPA